MNPEKPCTHRWASSGRSRWPTSNSQLRECSRCHSTLWLFPGDRSPDQEVLVSAAVMQAAQSGDCEALLPAIRAAVAAGWWVTPRDWALLLESVHPDLARWTTALTETYDVAVVRRGVEELAGERARAVTVEVPALRFAVRTARVPHGVKRAAHGRCDVAKREGEVLLLGMSGPTAADYGALVRWVRGEPPEVLREGGRYEPLSERLWSEETPRGVTLLRSAGRGEVVALDSLDEAGCHLSARPLEGGVLQLRWEFGDASTAAQDPRRRGRTEVRAQDGALLSSREGIEPQAPPGASGPKHPLDDGYARCIVSGGACWARQGRVQYAPLDGRGAWDEPGGDKWTGSTRLFVLTSFDGESPARYRVVDAHSGQRSAELRLARAPSQLSARAVSDGVLLVADAQFAYVTPQSTEPAWSALPCAATAVVGDPLGRRAVLAAADEPERYFVVDAERGLEGAVCAATPVRADGFGPVFLADDWWGALEWPD